MHALCWAEVFQEALQCSPWASALNSGCPGMLMEKRHLQMIVPMCLAGLVMKHNVRSSPKLLCLVSQGLYHNVSSKDGERTATARILWLLFQEASLPSRLHRKDGPSHGSPWGSTPGKPELGPARFFLFFKLEDNCFTVLCWFLPYGNVNQP